MASPTHSEPPDDPIFCSPPRGLIVSDQEEIDRGAYGSVYSGEIAGRPVAVKRIHPTLLEAQFSQGQNVLREFQAECQRMKDIGRHTNVVGFLGAFQDDKGPFLVMERMSQNLKKFLESNKGTLSLQHQVRLCLDIATGLAFLHSQEPPLVHRDLSARNVLLDEASRAKIGDLGQSKLKTAARFETRQPGAVPYMPPEALCTQPQYNEKVDIFSFGVLMLEIATQSPPLGGLEGIGTIPEEERRSGDLTCIAEDHPLKPLIRLCLKDEPTHRPDVAKLLEELQGVLQQSTQASIPFTEAKKCFSSAIEPLKEIHHKAIQLAEKTASPEFEDLMALPIARVAEILKVVGQSEMKVVFFGRTSNGKSTLINALLKSKVLPSGHGSTTTDICYIQGHTTDSEGGSVMIEGSNGLLKVQSAQALASCIRAPRNIQICWSTAQCSILKGGIVLVDCPGMNAEDDVDDKVFECCSDADVFVCVANGTTTFETSERNMLAKVKERISNPSNTFILFNHWDRVEEDGEEQARRVKQQQLGKVTRIMAHDLNIFTEEMVTDRTFFVSAKQAINNAEGNVGNAQQSGTSGRLQQEFSAFEEMLQECLLEEAIKTKFGRHYRECQAIVASRREALTCMKRRWTEECATLEGENRRIELKIINIDINLQNFKQLYDEKVEEAQQKIDVTLDEFYSKIKGELHAVIDSYLQKEEFDPKKILQYHRDMEKLLWRKLQEESQHLEECWSAAAAGAVQSLIALLLPHVEETISRQEADEASSRLGGDIPTSSQPSGCPESGQRPPSRLRRILLVGGAAVAGGVTGGATTVGIGKAAAVTASLTVVAPIVASVGAVVAGGGILFLTWRQHAISAAKDKAKKEIHKTLIEYLDRHKQISKNSYSGDLKNHVKSSTDAVCEHVEKQRQELTNAVDEVIGRRQDLRQWLLEARRLQYVTAVEKLEEMELQLKQFKETYLEM